MSANAEVGNYDASEVPTTRQEIEDLELKTVEFFEDTYKKGKNLRNKLFTENDKLSRALKESQAKETELEGELNATKIQLEKAQQENQEYEKKLKALQTNFAELNATKIQLEKAQQENQEYEKKLKALQTNFAKLRVMFFGESQVNDDDKLLTPGTPLTDDVIIVSETVKPKEQDGENGKGAAVAQGKDKEDEAALEGENSGHGKVGAPGEEEDEGAAAGEDRPFFALLDSISQKNPNQELIKALGIFLDKCEAFVTANKGKYTLETLKKNVECAETERVFSFIACEPGKDQVKFTPAQTWDSIDFCVKKMWNSPTNKDNVGNAKKRNPDGKKNHLWSNQVFNKMLANWHKDNQDYKTKTRACWSAAWSHVKGDNDSVKLAQALQIWLNTEPEKKTDIFKNATFKRKEPQPDAEGNPNPPKKGKHAQSVPMAQSNEDMHRLLSAVEVVQSQTHQLLTQQKQFAELEGKKKQKQQAQANSLATSILNKASGKKYGK